MGVPHFPGLYFQETHKVLVVKKYDSVRDQERIYIVKYTQDPLSRTEDFSRDLSNVQ